METLNDDFGDFCNFVDFIGKIAFGMMINVHQQQW